MFSEREMVASLVSRFPSYIGDDAALLTGADSLSWVITKDLLAEGVHFRTRYFSPKDLAHKALQVNLSDIAAMGGQARFILCGVSIPSGLEEYGRHFLESLAQQCRTQGIALVGGDMTRSCQDFFISVTALGVVLADQAKKRSTAEKGDFVCVAGKIGDAFLGLCALEGEIEGLCSFKDHFLKPWAHLAQGRWLAQYSGVTSMMDLSDGLWVDLDKLGQASQLGSCLNLDDIEYRDDFLEACQRLSIDPLEAFLTGGEDYGLLFTVQPEAWDGLKAAFLRNFALPLRRVGHMVSDLGVHFSGKRRLEVYKFKPFSHFGEGR